jgi:hypothetical protein
MKAFPDTIQLEDVGMSGESRIFRTLTRFRFFSEKHGLIEVPAGTRTDGASIPRVFWSILSPFGNYFQAALPHDYLYSPENTQLSRKAADEILLEGMVVLGVNPIRRFAIYRAVRMFGWRSFRGTPPN